MIKILNKLKYLMNLFIQVSFLEILIESVLLKVGFKNIYRYINTIFLDNLISFNISEMIKFSELASFNNTNLFSLILIYPSSDISNKAAPIIP